MCALLVVFALGLPPLTGLAQSEVNARDRRPVRSDGILHRQQLVMQYNHGLQVP